MPPFFSTKFARDIAPVKPDTRTAMRMLIAQIKTSIPLNAPESVLCSDYCRICSKKLIEFLGAEIDIWEYKLEQGVQPNFGDLKRLSKIAKKVHAALLKNDLIDVHG